MARQCVYEHKKWHCPKNPRRLKRTFNKKQCPDCANIFTRNISPATDDHIRIKAHAAVQNEQAGVGCSNCIRLGYVCQEAERKLWDGESGSTKEASIHVHMRTTCFSDVLDHNNMYGHDVLHSLQCFGRSRTHANKYVLHTSVQVRPVFAVLLFSNPRSTAGRKFHIRT